MLQIHTSCIILLYLFVLISFHPWLFWLLDSFRFQPNNRTGAPSSLVEEPLCLTRDGDLNPSYPVHRRFIYEWVNPARASDGMTT